MNTRTRTPISIVALTLAALVGTAAPALAAPEINRADCEAAGGTFSKEKGVKTCMTTTSQTGNVPMEAQFGGLRATWLEARTFEVTTTQTQKGNGEVSSSEDAVLVSRVALVQGRTCTFELAGNSFPVDTSECLQAGAYQ